MIAAALVALTVLSGQDPTSAAPPPAVELATLRGQVTTSPTGQPVAGVRVRAIHVTGVAQPTLCALDDCDAFDGRDRPHPTYLAITGDDGRFEMRGVKPGEYIVQAGGAGYLTRAYGQRSYDQPEGRLAVPPERVTRVDIQLEQPATLSGRILSDAGDGLASVEVELVRRTYRPGGAAPTPVAFVQSEADGAFTFRNVVPGEYYVHAYDAAARRPRRGGPTTEYTSTYFPDATDPGGAQPVAAGSGQQLDGIDFALVAATTHVVTGQLVDTAGPPLTTATVQLTPQRRGGVVEPLAARVAADGRFRFERVLAGDYTTRVQDAGGEQRWLGAVQNITVVDDRTELVVAAAPGARLEGRVTIPDGETLPIPIIRLNVEVEQRMPGTSSITAMGARTAEDGSFGLTAAPGESSAWLTGLPEGWFVRTILVDGLDVTDRPFDLFPADRRRIDFVVSSRAGRLTGRVTDDDAQAVSQAIVVVFPDDWGRLSRTRLVGTAFSSAGGRFDINGLPPGNYRAVAVSWLPRDAWKDGEVLARLWTSSESIRIDAAEDREVQLTVTAPPEDLFR